MISSLSTAPCHVIMPVTRREGRYELADLNSTNGTFVNGQRLSGSVAVKQGDEIRFGEVRFLFSAPGSGLGNRRIKPGRIGRIGLQALTIGLTLIAGAAGGFVGGVVATHNAQTITAGQFVVVDQTGKPRVVMAVLPERGTVPNCRVCDGQAHVIVLDERGTSTMWPTTGPQSLSAEQLIELLKLAAIFAKAG
jgi:hypothetical protein